MYRRIKHNYYFLLLLLLYSCATEPEESSAPVFFDLKSFIEGEAGKLTSRHFSLYLTISTNDTTESHLLESVNWANELKSFSECDINRKAWMNSYRTDTISKGNSTLVKYSAKDSSLVISTMQVIFHKNIPVSIQVIKKNNKQFYSHYNYLRYVPEKYFIIDNWQKINFTENIHIKIEGEIIK